MMIADVYIQLLVYAPTHPPGDELVSSGEALDLPTISEPLPSQLKQPSPPVEELPEGTGRTADVEETGSPTPQVLAAQGTYCIWSILLCAAFSSVKAQSTIVGIGSV